MPDKKLTDELLNELLDAPNIDGYIKEHDFAAPSLSDYLKQLLQEKGLESQQGAADCLCDGAVDEGNQSGADGCRGECSQLQGPSRCNHYLLHRPWL